MRIAKSTAAGLAAFCAVYLVGVFAAADFNIANWDAETRLCIAVIGATFAAGGFMAAWE